MASTSFVGGLERSRYVEVEVVRLLLILNRFALPIDNTARQPQC
jgi:hypothetical protein